MKPPLLKLNRSSRPRGISLVEMVLSITLIAVAITLIGRVTLQLARLERTVNDQRQTDEAWRRLARDFRADAHAARSVIAISEDDHKAAAALRFTRDDEATADYRVAQDSVVRILRRGDRVVHRERYRLGPRNWSAIALKKPAEVTTDSDHVGSWAEITGGDATDLGGRRVQWRILAAITGEVARSSPRQSRKRQPRHRRLRRSGAVLAAALVALLIITMFSAVLIRRSYLARQQTRLANHRLQASWVVESMVRRAILRAETKPIAESLRLVIPTMPGNAVSSDNMLQLGNGASEKASGEKTAGEKAVSEKTANDEGRVQLAGEREVWRVTIDWVEVPGESTTWNLQVTATLGDETRPIVVERRERRVKLGQKLPQPKEGNDES